MKTPELELPVGRLSIGTLCRWRPSAEEPWRSSVDVHVVGAVWSQEWRRGRLPPLQFALVAQAGRQFRLHPRVRVRVPLEGRVSAAHAGDIQDHVERRCLTHHVALEETGGRLRCPQGHEPIVPFLRLLQGEPPVGWEVADPWGGLLGVVLPEPWGVLWL